MKIAATNYAAGLEQASAKSRPARNSAGETAFVPPGQARKEAAGHAAQAENTTATENSAGISGQKSTPPGLERVQEKLQALSTQQLEKGRGTALHSIERNLARYIANQGGSTGSSPTPATGDTGTTDPVAGTPPAAGDTTGSTTGSTTGDTTAGTTAGSDTPIDTTA